MNYLNTVVGGFLHGTGFGLAIFILCILIKALLGMTLLG